MSQSVSMNCIYVQDDGWWKAVTKSEINLQKSTAELKHQLEVETTKGRRFEQQIEAVNTGRQEFDAILKEIPSSVARELVKKDGILAKLLSSGDATQAK